MVDLNPKWDANKYRDEAPLLAELTGVAALDPSARTQIVARAADFVTQVRTAQRPGLMDVFLAEYGLSTDEGVALMCLAEALLRVPDAPTIDALIEDKIAPSDWSRHIGHSSSPLVNASTWGLMLTGKVLEADQPGMAGQVRALVRRLGEPVIRAAVARAMREMGRQFVLGQDIDAAMTRAKVAEAQGYTYSYDMLGEAAMTAADAQRYAVAYGKAIDAIARACVQDDIAANPGISVKLSALHPRYEVAQADRVMAELVPVLRDLARKAARAGMGLNIDAEEMDRLSLSLHVIEAVLADPELAGWDGFGVVVQAYGRRAGDVIDSLYQMAETHNRRLMVRLVKGAYWDTEVKRAQVEGLHDFPVFTRKAATDVSYLANARRLLDRTDRLYPQFATHNAHTVASILHMAQDVGREAFEFQRLHGMGASLHQIVHDQTKARCRIYAPVGAHRDLLAYLVRRLLENGANSSFVNQVVDADVPAEQVAACPFAALKAELGEFEPVLRHGPDLFAPERVNARGFDLTDVTALRAIADARQLSLPLRVAPILAGPVQGGTEATIQNPSNGAQIGNVLQASIADVQTALSAATPWDASATIRARVLTDAADLFERDFGSAFELLALEAGKALPDAVAELREAVDFLRYYANTATTLTAPPRGIVTCISPWNFPLAIFTGQIAAALAAGNAVLSKPAETTPAMAAWAVERLHSAGVPRSALQLLPGDGPDVGAALCSDVRVNAVAFTGSTATARLIQAMMADHCAPGTPLVAETGGMNAMVVDSTALPEQAVRDIVNSAFRSSGQRCSALRCLYVQEDIAPIIQKMLIGAMNELRLGDPSDLRTDVGPVITAQAQADIAAHVAAAQAEGRLIHQCPAPAQGHFIGPALIRVPDIAALGREVFGPVLHMATFRAGAFEQVIAQVNATGYGLTFGLHTRIDTRVQVAADSVTAGNIYANRNQIGAVVGSQPFGGDGLSGTGPKAGGPIYVTRFTKPVGDSAAPPRSTRLPGPTGELNQYTLHPRAKVLCLGPGEEHVAAQMAAIQALGGQGLAHSDPLSPEGLTTMQDIGGVLWWGDETHGRAMAQALAKRDGPIIPLITGQPDAGHALLERHLCVDTTAAGGNASLMAGGH